MIQLIQKSLLEFYLCRCYWYTYLLDPKYFGEHIDIADIPKIIEYTEWGSQTATYSDDKKEILKFVANSRASIPDEDDTHPRSWWGY